MKAKTKNVAYGKLRELVKQWGGRMEYVRKGQTGENRWGVWQISLGRKSRTFSSKGEKTFPQLDRLFIPSPGIKNPKTWEHYDNKLIPGAEKQLRDLLD